jgi:hypothetical protein
VSTPNQSPFFLTSYHEEITDTRGIVTSRDWNSASYNEWGEVTEYKETNRQTINGKELTQTINWSNGQYDNQGHVISYEEKKK